MPGKGFNPFYSLLVVVGVVFAMTACAYGVMTVRKLRSPQQPDPHPLVEALDEHGFTVLMTELAVLATMTFAAMGTDSYWIRRAEKSASAAAAGADQQSPSTLDSAESPPEGTLNGTEESVSSGDV